MLEGTVRQQRRGGQHPQHTRQRRQTGERREPAEIPRIVRRQRDQQHGAEDHRLARLHRSRAGLGPPASSLANAKRAAKRIRARPARARCRSSLPSQAAARRCRAIAAGRGPGRSQNPPRRRSRRGNRTPASRPRSTADRGTTSVTREGDRQPPVTRPPEGRQHHRRQEFRQRRGGQHDAGPDRPAAHGNQQCQRQQAGRRGIDVGVAGELPDRQRQPGIDQQFRRIAAGDRAAARSARRSPAHRTPPSSPSCRTRPGVTAAASAKIACAAGG